MKRSPVIAIIIISLAILLVGVIGWVSLRVSNPWNARCLGEVPCLRGFQRTDTGDPSYNAFLRGLPLKQRGAKVQLHTGGNARLQWLSSGVINWPTLSNSEQCADVTMRIRSEYLWKQGRFKEICFTRVDGKKHAYKNGTQRGDFESYMKTVYGICNTSSVYKETKVRAMKDIRPGDILVYPSRRRGAYGHAILVADVAQDKKGRIAILCVEGNTPAREAHIVRNFNPFRNPWHIISAGKDIHISVFIFHPNELRYYP